MLLRNTALEAMRAYGTDTTRRMYFYRVFHQCPAGAAFCMRFPPGSKGEFVTLLPPTDVPQHLSSWCLRESAHGAAAALEYAAEHHFSPRGTLRHIYLGNSPSIGSSKFDTQVVLLIEDADENMAGNTKWSSAGNSLQ